MDNAFKYTPGEGKIELTAKIDPKGFLLIRVKDTGIGIAPADLEHIFERFYRADTTRSSSGTGLGLAIAKWIVEQHQGEIKVESRVGEGTVFTVVLPLLQKG